MKKHDLLYMLFYAILAIAVSFFGYLAIEDADGAEPIVGTAINSTIENAAGDTTAVARGFVLSEGFFSKPYTDNQFFIRWTSESSTDATMTVPGWYVSSDSAQVMRPVYVDTSTAQNFPTYILQTADMTLTHSQWYTFRLDNPVSSHVPGGDEAPVSTMGGGGYGVRCTFSFGLNTTAADTGTVEVLPFIWEKE